MLTFGLLALASLASAPASAESPVVQEVSVESSVPSPWAMVLPFGVPQFATQRNRLGLVFGGMQALSVAGAVYSGMEMNRLATEIGQGNGDPNLVDQELAMRDVSKYSVALAGVFWFVSVVDGSNAREVALEKAKSARMWEAVQPTTLPGVAIR